MNFVKKVPFFRQNEDVKSSIAVFFANQKDRRSFNVAQSPVPTGCRNATPYLLLLHYYLLPASKASLVRALAPSERELSAKLTEGVSAYRERATRAATPSVFLPCGKNPPPSMREAFLS